MRKLWPTFLSICEEEYARDPDHFLRHYNNRVSASRNRKGRTTMMLGKGEDRDGGLVWRAVQRRFKPEALGWEGPRFESYADLILWSGDFNEGRQLPELVCEVEDSTDLRLGELSYLLWSTSRRKLVLRYPGPLDDSNRSKIEAFVSRAFRDFAERGYREAPDTEYLLMFGPGQLGSMNREDWQALNFRSSEVESGGFRWLQG